MCKCVRSFELGGVLARLCVRVCSGVWVSRWVWVRACRCLCMFHKLCLSICVCARVWMCACGCFRAHVCVCVDVCVCLFVFKSTKELPRPVSIQVRAGPRRRTISSRVALASLGTAGPAIRFLLSKATADRRECGAEHWLLHVGRVSVGTHRDLGLPTSTRLFVAPLSPTSSAFEACAVCVR